MEIFEVHITGDEKIIKAAKPLNIKTIIIDLVKPDKSYLRTEYMTSHACHFPSYNECKAYVDNLANQLKAAGVDIVRIKIECPYYPKYKDRSLYFEVHYDATDNSYPLSRNQGKDSFLCTAREYDRKRYDALANKHRDLSPNLTMELCLYDTNVGEDNDWFTLYGPVV